MFQKHPARYLTMRVADFEVEWLVRQFTSFWVELAQLSLVVESIAEVGKTFNRNCFH